MIDNKKRKFQAKIERIRSCLSVNNKLITEDRKLILNYSIVDLVTKLREGDLDPVSVLEAYQVILNFLMSIYLNGSERFTRHHKHLLFFTIRHKQSFLQRKLIALLIFVRRVELLLRKLNWYRKKKGDLSTACQYPSKNAFTSKDMIILMALQKRLISQPNVMGLL